MLLTNSPNRKDANIIVDFALDRRNQATTDIFIDGLRAATASKPFQITTDGFQPNISAIETTLFDRADYGMFIKVYAAPREGEQRYSPADVVEALPRPILGNPDRERICTSHVERQNLTMRMQIQRLTRLTNGFSKKLGEPVGFSLPTLSLLQLLPNSPDNPGHPGDVTGNHRSGVDNWGVAIPKMDDKLASNDTGNRDEQIRFQGEAVFFNTRLEDVEHQQAEQKKRDEDYKQRDDEYKRRQVELNGRLVKLTLWLVIVGAAGMGVAIFQSTISKQAADAATSASGTAQNTLRAMKTSGEETKNQVERLIAQQQRTADSMERILGQSREAMDRSERQSSAALETSIAAIRLDQRPWLTVTRFSLSSELEKNKGVYVEYFLKNTGKTPALEQTSQSWMFISPVVPVLTEFPEPTNPNRSLSVVPPGDVPKSTSSQWTPPAEFISAYSDGTARFYLHVMIRYRDTFGGQHWTTACAYHIYGAPLTDFKYCSTGNDMDRNHYAQDSPQPPSNRRDRLPKQD